MLRIILIIIISYLVIRILLRLLLEKSPSQRRAERNTTFQGKETDARFGNRAKQGDASRFDNIQDAEYEEISPDDPPK